MNETMRCMTQEVPRDENPFLKDEFTPIATVNESFRELDDFEISIRTMSPDGIRKQISYLTKLITEFENEIPPEEPYTLWDKEIIRLRNLAKAKLNIANNHLKLFSDI